MNRILLLLEQHCELTSSQISQILKMTAREVILYLVKLEKESEVVQCNGFWSLSEETRLNQSLSIRILALIEEWGEISASEIAFITGIRTSLITQFLVNCVNKEVITRKRKDNMYLYKLSDDLSH